MKHDAFASSLGKPAPVLADLFGNGANAADFASDGDRRWDIPFLAQSGAGNSAEIAVRFLESLKIPQGPSAGNPVTLAPFQKQFVTRADG
jgi:hypothetical protein